jgi:hypothetical protein
MTDHRFETQRVAAFLASRAELQAALPGWRTPLPEPGERTGVNPFTGAPVRVMRTRDPQPGVPVPVPESLPFEHILLPDRDDWISDYVVLDLVLFGESDISVPEWDADANFVVLMKGRGLFESPLHGRSGRLLLTVPSRVVLALNAMEDRELGRVLAEWNARSSSQNTREELTQFWQLARRATEQGRELFLWLDMQPREPGGEARKRTEEWRRRRGEKA